ncbi:MAG: TIGR01777 family oxidoreductase [Bacteroidales bacterium]|nr:TIGR01777 family oxidoreductase [Bacteroidales bacterium]
MSKKKTILLTGGRGFIGNFLLDELKNDFDFIILSSQPISEWKGFPVRSLQNRANLLSESEFNQCFAIIHLSGINVAKKKWTRKQKQLLRDSRIKPLDQLFRMVHKKTELKVLLTASGIGYYDHTSSVVKLEENSPAGKSFFSRLCVDWEAAAFRFQEKGLRVAALRMGLVLHPSGGFLKPFLKLNRFWLANSVGNPLAWFSWIHVVDTIRMYRFLVERQDLEGVFNAVSPNPLTQKDFMRTLRQIQSTRVIIPPVPAFLVRLMMGERAKLVLEGKPVYPTRMLEAGFEFKYPTLEEALRSFL